MKRGACWTSLYCTVVVGVVTGAPAGRCGRRTRGGQGVQRRHAPASARIQTASGRRPTRSNERVPMISAPSPGTPSGTQDVWSARPGPGHFVTVTYWGPGRWTHLAAADSVDCPESSGSHEFQNKFDCCAGLASSGPAARLACRCKPTGLGVLLPPLPGSDIHCTTSSRALRTSQTVI